MNRLQKQSWILVVSIAVAFVISCLIVAYLAFTAGFPRAWSGFLFTNAGLLSYVVLPFVKKDVPAIVDERDLAIRSLALTNAIRAAFIFLVLFAMGVFIYKKPGSFIKVDLFPMSVCLTAVVAAVFESLTYIVEYGKGGRQTEGESA